MEPIIITIAAINNIITTNKNNYEIIIILDYNSYNDSNDDDNIQWLGYNNDEKLQHLRLSNNNTSFEKENDLNTIINFVRNYQSNTKTIINAIKEKIGYK